MIFGFLILATALTLSVVAAFYSVTGLIAIFAALPVPIMIMGGALEIAKVVTTVFLHNNWDRLGALYKAYLVPAVAVLMFITSLGIFGLLSKAHSDQSLVSGDVSAKISIYDEQIRTERENIDANRKQLKQMDDAVDQVMARSTSETGADKANGIRKSQAKDRQRIASEITSSQKKIAGLNDQRAPIAAEIRKVEADVGPLKYIAAFVYGDNPDANVLERAVTWVIILIVMVFDPLALCLILAANKQFEWARHGEGGWIHDEKKEEESEDDSEENKIQSWFDRAKERARFWDKQSDKVEEPESFVALVEDLEPVVNEPVVIPEEYDAPEVPVEKPKQQFAGFPWTFSTLNTPAPFKKRKTARVKKVVEPVTVNAPGLDASDERPGDYVKVEEQPRVNLEAAPGVNRGINATADAPATGVRRKYVPTEISADNTIQLGKASNTSFGDTYPTNPERGDVYLRTDYLPNRLFKFNGNKWIEVDKDTTDVYAYDELYIKHLVQEIEANRYDAESLTDVEREQIANYLGKNA